MILTTLMTAAALNAAAPTGVQFQHKDWEMACDNTRTCRAAGYSGESGGISVLLTREGGASGQISGELIIGDADVPEFQERPLTEPLTLTLDGSSLGTLNYDTALSHYRIPQALLAPLIKAIKGSGAVAFSASPDYHWPLSGAGAYAVLLKIDEFQGRIGTATALTKTGNGAIDQIPPAVPAPIIHAAPTLSAEGQDLTAAELKAVYQRLGKEECEPVDDESRSGRLYSLDNSHQLVEALCWRAAYNEGYAYLVVPTGQPLAQGQLVTLDGSAYANGEISASQRGRGIADCMRSDSWVWDGSRFIHSESMTSGDCRNLVIGGTWQLPTLTSTVIKGH